MRADRCPLPLPFFQSWSRALAETDNSYCVSPFGTLFLLVHLALGVFPFLLLALGSFSHQASWCLEILPRFCLCHATSYLLIAGTQIPVLPVYQGLQMPLECLVVSASFKSLDSPQRISYLFLKAHSFI